MKRMDEEGHQVQKGKVMGQFGQDEIGLYKTLPDGRVLRVAKQLFNAKLTLSNSQQDQGWEQGW
jgi:hypothetical protein